MLREYISGRGLDVCLKPKIGNARQEYIEPGNLYLLRNKVGVEEFDYLYTGDLISQTKYHRILLYEWFLVIKPGGYLILEFKENHILDLKILRDELNNLFLYKDGYQIISEETSGKTKSIVIKKTKSIKSGEDEINKWTIGIITNGKRPDFLKKSIDSIKSLGIPNYEIIICGTFLGDTSGIRYIHFAEKDERGWITKKKNLICENAKFENICIVHDRVYFDKYWFTGMKQYGNYFDVLSFPIYDTQKIRAKYPYANWGTLGRPWDYNKLVYGLNITGGQLSPQDWDRYCFVGGAAIAIKKYIWELAKWNENLFWREYEDIELSHRQHKRGIMVRFNYFSKLYSMAISQLTIIGVPYYKRNKKKLGPYSVSPIFLLLVNLLELMGLRKNSPFLLSIKERLAKLKQIKTSMDKK